MTIIKTGRGFNFEKWFHQNKGEYGGDFVEGVLLDSFTVVTKRGVAAFYDTFVNTNESCYTIKFGSFKSGEADKVLADFMDFEDRCERERSE